MAASSSSSQGHAVFPSFRGEDVRETFLSHLLLALDRRSISSFRDNGIERSRPISPELLSAIRAASISIVIFSKNYASSTWCLNELVEIHKCYKELHQMVIPVFYHVDPSHVRKQTREFGKAFEETCMGKPEDQKQGWRQALADVASIAGEDSQNWVVVDAQFGFHSLSSESMIVMFLVDYLSIDFRCDEANMIETIANDVSNKLFTPSSDFGDIVGVEDHLKRLTSLLFLESEEVKMLGIVGHSGIGKSTIGRALFKQLSSQFPRRNFVTYKSTDREDYSMQLCWVEQRLKHKKVFIILDDVNSLEFLKTLVGKTEWFGPGSRIIVITQDRQLLKSHDIDLLYEVKIPSQDLALEMLCQSAFGENSPTDDFKELAVKVATLAGNLPLGLRYNHL